MRVPGTLVLLVLAGCDTDTSITKRNDAPVAVVEAPADGTTAREGDTVTLRGRVTDTDHDADDLVATWFSGADVLCDAAPVAEDGTTECVVVVGVDDAAIQLEGRDPENATGYADLRLEIVPTGIPSVDILAPDGAGRLYDDVPVVFAAVVADTEDDPADLSVEWTDEAGTVLDIDATPDEDGALSGSWTFPEGPHAVRIAVTDTTGKRASATVAFSVGGPNVPPTCTITAPADGAVAVVGDLLSFGGTVVDDDVAEDQLVATWSSDLDGTLATVAADLDGNVFLDTTALSAGTHTVTLTGSDDVGATCTADVVVHVGGPPTVEIDLPLDGDVYGEGALTSFSATVSDDATAPEALILTWESDLDGVLDTTPADASGLAAFDTIGLSVGAHTITLTAVDELGLSSTAAVSFVVNGLPGAPTVTIEPTRPTGVDDLVATVLVDAPDPEGDAVTYTYAWSVDGVATAYTSATIPAAATTRGERWEVSVTPNDGYGDGPAASASVTIGNTAPTLADVTLTPDPAFEGDTLTCAPGASSDTDGDAIGHVYAWTVNGAPLAETGASLDASNWRRDDVVVCIVTPTDFTDAGAAVASAPLTISNSAPGLGSVEITPGPAGAEDTLTCVARGFSDADGDADASVYEWTVSGVYAGSGRTLAGAFLGGDEVICAVTAFDGTDYGVTLVESVTIDNTPPVLAGVTLTPPSPTEADVLVCTPGATTDADGSTSFTYTYGWTVGGARLAATGSTLDGASFDAGDVITCHVTPNDGGDDGATVTSNAVTAINTPPTITSVTLSPTSPATDDTITATVGTADVDGDTVSVTYTWYVNGVVVVGSGASLGGGSFAHGDSVHVVVTPDDGTDDGAPVASAPVIVENTLPVVSSVVLTPTTAYEATTLTCAPTATDADGDALSWSYTWAVNGAGIAATGSTLTGASFDRGDAVACAATPSDGHGSGAPMTSNTVTISNTPPVASTVTVTPTSATESSTLTCSASGTDADGDALSWTYAWYVDSGVVSGATSATLTGASFGSGDAVYCRATPTDGSTAGAAMSSNVVTIGNTAPVLSAVTLTPTSATEGSTLTCAATASDIDGDTLSYGYAWFVNGGAVSGTSATLTGASFDAGDSVYCQITPNDGVTSGTAMASNVVTIGNTAPVASTVTLTPTTAYEGSTLTCAASGTDADGDTVSWTYAWTVNGTTIAATTSTLTGASFAKGNTVSCRATPSDGTASGTAMTSNTVTISNTAPVASTVTLTPTTPTASSTLTCSASGTDADGDAVSFTYAWYVNGGAIAATGSTLTGASFGGGDTVYCRATPTDGSSSGTAMSSNTVTIANTAPVLTAVTLTPTTAYETSTLTCSASGTDADGDAITYSYAWYVNGGAIAATGSTLTGSSFSKGNTVYCRATPSDGATSGTAMSSNTVTISNTAPVVSSVTLTPTTAYESSTLTCSASGTDADGDAITYSYAWYVNGGAIAATGSTLTGSSFSKGNTVYCRATPSDGSGTGTAVSSNTVTIANTAPVLAGASLTPTIAYETSTLTCAPSGASDVDGDAISYSYAWYVNGVNIGRTTTTLTGTYFAKDDAVYCRVTPGDGSSTGTAVSSNTVSVRNTAPSAATVSITPSAPSAGLDDLRCVVSAGSTDVDGDAVDYDITWYADGAPYPGSFSGVTGPRTTVWPDDTIPAADTHLATTWTCLVVPFDDDDDGPSASASVVVTAECGGVPVGPVCSGGTVHVAHLPGWGATHTSSSNQSWGALEAGSLTYGGCTIDITSVSGGFTLATLSGYDAIIVSDPAGGSRVYSTSEQAAIRAYLEGGYGGAVGSFLMSYFTYDNTGLYDLFGVDAAGIVNESTSTSGTATVVDASHPVVDGLSGSYTLLGYLFEQSNDGGWTSDDLLTCASFVITGGGGSSVIVNDAARWRTVYFTGMPEYQSAGADGQRTLYNALLWAAGYQ